MGFFDFLGTPAGGSALFSGLTTLAQGLLGQGAADDKLAFEQQKFDLAKQNQEFNQGLAQQEFQLALAQLLTKGGGGGGGGGSSQRAALEQQARQNQIDSANEGTALQLEALNALVNNFANSIK